MSEKSESKEREGKFGFIATPMALIFLGSFLGIRRQIKWDFRICGLVPQGITEDRDKLWDKTKITMFSLMQWA